MTVLKIDYNTYVVSESYLWGLYKKKYTVFIDWENRNIRFPKYNLIYYKNSGKKVPQMRGFKVQDVIKANKRLESWK